MSEERCYLDYETRSECDIKKSGSWRYSLHPSTEIMCLVYRLPYWDDGRTELWHPAFPHLGIKADTNWDALGELLEWIEAGGLVEAHNAFFERGIWTNILVPVYGFPAITHRQWRCSAAKAASHALPRKLDGAGAALGLSISKDMEGSELMLKMCKPRKPLKKERVAWAVTHAGCPECAGRGKVKVGRARATACGACGGLGWDSTRPIPPMPTLWHESPDQMARLWDYCRVDVLSEESLSQAIPDLNEAETEMYLLDQAINERGFMIDRDAVEMALAVIEAEAKKLTAELQVLTRGQVERATQRDRMKAWFARQGLVLENTQALTIAGLLNPPNPTMAYPVRRGLEIMRDLGRSSTTKYLTMQRWACPDDRVRGGLLYHGATTGRWSGAGVQPHNFPKGKIKKDSTGAAWDIETAWDSIMSEDDEGLAGLFGSVMEPLSQALRGAIIPTPGTHLYVADFAGIEARGLLWAAEDEEGLDIFRKGEDIYLTMASSIYGYPCNKTDHPFERALGKVAILGLGYQMGWKKFIDSAWTMGGIRIDEALSQQTVDAYRSQFWRVKQMWQDQEDAAIEATRAREGTPVASGRMIWVREDVFLYCILPSGRRLAYPFPRVRLGQTPWGADKVQLVFKGVNPVTRQWHTQTTYGGMLVENQVQAISRDLMAEALYRCEQSGVYTPVLSVHDEMIAEADPAVGTVPEFEQLMAHVPEWAQGWPIAAEGWAGKRYRK